MKTTWRIIIAIWFLAWTILGINIYLDTPRQIEKDNKFKTLTIDPLVDSVKSFVTTNKRIPKDNEFNKLNTDHNGELITNYADLPDEFKDKIEIDNWDKDTYAIAIWRGEWNEGYISKDDTYVLNNYSWTEGLKGLLIIIGIGLLPTLLTLLVSKINRD
jgi:hypothetical protein